MGKKRKHADSAVRRIIIVLEHDNSTGAYSMTDIRTEEINYTADGVEMMGYLAWDTKREGPRPGVLVVHEWWGCNEYAQRRARMLAEVGYTGMAVDLYGAGRVAANPDEAGELMNTRIDDMAGNYFAAGAGQCPGSGILGRDFFYGKIQ